MIKIFIESGIQQSARRGKGFEKCIRGNDPEGLK